MKRFMYLSIGVLCLSLSALIGFHIGNRTAEAQTMDAIYVTTAPGTGYGAYLIAVLPNGDVYRRGISSHVWDPWDPPEYVGNFWNLAPVPTENTTWGGIKSLMDGKKD